MKAWESGVDGPTQKKSSLYSDLQDLKAEVQEVEQAVQPEHTRKKRRANGVIWNCDCAGEMI